MNPPKRVAGRSSRWPPRKFLGLSLKKFRALERLVLTALVIAASVQVLRHQHAFDAIEVRWLDFLAYLSRPSFEAPVVVVAVTDEAYHDPGLFGGMSPLDPAALRRLVVSVARHRPLGAVLDVQIHPAPHESPDRAAARLGLYATLDSLALSGGPRWILIRDARAEAVAGAGAGTDSLRRAWEALTSNSRILWADATLSNRRDGMVRGVPRFYSEGTSQAVSPTILGAAAELLESRTGSSPSHGGDHEGPESPWHIRYTGRFLEDSGPITSHLVDARLVVSGAGVGNPSLLSDKLLLIGGTHQEGRDAHLTPVGEMAGVFVWAEAIASWIRRDALHEPPEWLMLLAEVVLGVLSGLILLRFGPGPGLGLNLLLIVPLALVTSALTYGDGVLFLNFLPSAIAVYLHYQIELHHELGHLRREVEKGKRRRQRNRRRVSNPDVARDPAGPTPT